MKLPWVSEQVAFWSQLSVPAVHSFTFEQVTPFPVQPVLQAHVKLPWVSLQVAFWSQLSVPAVHSLTFAHVLPLPV